MIQKRLENQKLSHSYLEMITSSDLTARLTYLPIGVLEQFLSTPNALLLFFQLEALNLQI